MMNPKFLHSIVAALSLLLATPAAADELRTIHSALLPYFEKLVAAAGELHPSLRGKKAKLVIEATTVRNAYYRPDNDKEFTIVMNTGFVARAFDAFPDTSEAMKVLVGTLAHEVSHAIPFEDLRNFTDPLTGQQISPEKIQQLLELRADTDAVHLLHRAALPTDALATHFQIHRNEGMTRGSVLGALDSTHPQTSLRRTVASLALAMDSAGRGTNPKTQPIAPAPEVSKALNRLSFVDTGRLPKNLDELLKHWESIKRESGRMDLRGGAAHFVAELDEFAARLGDRFTKRDAERIARVRTWLVMNDGLRSLEIFGDRTALNQVPLFKSETYQNEVNQILQQESNKLILVHSLPESVLPKDDKTQAALKQLQKIEIARSKPREVSFGVSEEDRARLEKIFEQVRKQSGVINFSELDPDTIRKLYAEAKKSNPSLKAASFLFQFTKMVEPNREYYDALRVEPGLAMSRTRASRALGQELLADFRDMMKRTPDDQKVKRAREFLFTYFPIASVDSTLQHQMIFDPSWKAISKEYFDILKGLPLTEKDVKELHQALSRGGLSEHSDAFLRHYIDHGMPNLAGYSAVGVKGPDLYVEGRRVPTHESFVSTSAFRNEAALLAYQQAHPATEKNWRKQLESLVTLFPHPGEERDKLLESLLWQHGLQTESDLKAVEAFRSQNALQVVGNKVGILSSVSSLLEGLTPSEKIELMETLVSGSLKGGKLPPNLQNAIDRIQLLLAVPPSKREELEKQLAAGKKFNLNDVLNIWRPEERERIVSRLKQQTDSLLGQLREIDPKNAIPVFTLLTLNGEVPLARNSDFINETFPKLMKLDPSDPKTAVLKAFLKSIPEHELPAYLGVLLSEQMKARGGNLSWADIFSSFGPVGIKAGQLGAIFKVLDPSVTNDLENLKSHAPDLPKTVILDVLKRNLPADEFKRVKVHRILGCASIKCTVLVSYDGEPGMHVLGVRRPNIEGQNRRSLALAESFLNHLEEEGVRSNSQLLQALSNGLRKTLREEEQLDKDARKLEESRQVYERVQQSLGKEMGRWHFEVPTSARTPKSTPELIYMSYAKGKPWEELSEAGKREAGRIIAASGIQSLFQEGWFNPDQHHGNFLFDEEKGTIYVLDPGQASRLRRGGLFGLDEPYELAQFIRALATGNTEAALLHGSRLSSARSLGEPPSELRTQLEKLHKKYNDAKGTKPEALQDFLVEVANAFAAAGRPLRDETLFVGLKGLMVLSGENYVSPSEFSALVENQIQRLLTEDKPVRSVLDHLRAGGTLEELPAKFGTGRRIGIGVALSCDKLVALARRFK